MKKIICAVLASIMVISLCGCGKVNEKIIGDLAYMSVSEEELTKFVNDLNPERTEKTRNVFYNDLNTLLLSLDNGNIWGASLFESVCKYIMGQNPGKYVSADFGTQSAFAMALKDNNNELLEKLNDAIEELKMDGTLENLKEEYLSNCDTKQQPKPSEIPVIENAPTYKVVVTGDIPPMDYVTADGQAAGYNVALLSAISQKAGINFELLYADAASRAVMIVSGKADIVFWTRGLIEDSGEATFQGDLPSGIKATIPYLVENTYGLFKAE